MACKCVRIANTYVVNDSSSNVVLQFTDNSSVPDKGRFCFKVVTDLPSSAASYQLYATVNGSSVPVLNKFGNPMLVSDVKKCRLYKGWYGATTPHVITANSPVTYNTGCGNVL